MRGFAVFLLLLTCCQTAIAENYLLNGGQDSRIDYTVKQRVVPASGTRLLTLSFVVPQAFNSVTYRQRIESLNWEFSPQPTRRHTTVDIRGNDVLEVAWTDPVGPVVVNITLTAINAVNLSPVRTNAPYPMNAVSKATAVYLKPSTMVDSENHRIRGKAEELTRGARSEFDAVQRILSWVVDHMQYVLTPERYDASYSFETGAGNCQNYSHLAAALMRAAGIPVRIVNGVTLKKPYDIQLPGRVLSMRMAQGRHSWIEVFFPDLGWMPFDPSGTELFVSNRFIRVEVGLDNEETGKDGLMRWVHAKGIEAKPGFEEQIQTIFTRDRIGVTADTTGFGPKNLLLSPRVEGAFAKVAPPPPPSPAKKPDVVPPSTGDQGPYVFGNLNFPEGLDFLDMQAPARQTAEGAAISKKNFVVETAEYVTTRGQQYAQTFIVKQPIRLDAVGLALHRFNADGQLWLEIYKDREGSPGKHLATSRFMDLAEIRYSPGYTWVDFSFDHAAPTLSPGRYWMALGFAGSPVVNWFYSYGKPVGPQDGTRFRRLFDEKWSRSLPYEFNYRIVASGEKAGAKQKKR